jgi:hypothetical protein
MNLIFSCRQSRSSVPAVSAHIGEDEEMISDEESDNEDLIDGDSSNSDWSYLNSGVWMAIKNNNTD